MRRSQAPGGERKGGDLGKRAEAGVLEVLTQGQRVIEKKNIGARAVI